MEKKIVINLEKIAKYIKKNLMNLYILLFFIIITLLMTYPLVFNIDSSFPAAGDTYEYAWDFWYTKQALFQGTSPFFSNYIFYPNGVSLAFHDTTMFNSLLSIPFQLIFNLTTVYNLLFLFSFILSGFGAYMLVFYLTKNKRASIISGLLFAFFPYHFAHITHLSLLTMGWIPLFILYFIKIFEEASMKNAIFSSILLTLTALSHWYYLVFLVFFAIIFLVYNFFHKKNYILNRKSIKNLILMFLLFGILISPFIIPLLQDNEFQSVNTLDSSIAHSADVIAFFVPSETHSIFGKYVNSFYNSINSYDGKLYGIIEESTVFLGYLTLILAFYTLTIKNKKHIRFWLLGSLIFLILSLGPVLHFNGLIKIPVEGLGLDKVVQKIEPNINMDALEMLKHNIGIPLPYIVINFIPFFNVIRNPSRFVVMLMISLTVIVGFACDDIFNKTKHKKIFNRYGLENVLFLIFCLVIVFEFLSIPLPTSSVKIPSFYSTIAKDKEDYAIIEIPLCHDVSSSYTPKIRLFQYYQTVHNKKLLCGAISRYPEKSFDFIRENPFIYSLSDPETVYVTSVPIDFLKQNKLKYIIIHKNYLKENEIVNLNNLLRNSLQLQYQDNEMIVYRIY